MEKTTTITLNLDYSKEGWVNWLEYHLDYGLAGFVNRVVINGVPHKVKRVGKHKAYFLEREEQIFMNIKKWLMEETGGKNWEVLLALIITLIFSYLLGAIFGFN